jgi:hypothetical protein
MSEESCEICDTCDTNDTSDTFEIELEIFEISLLSLFNDASLPGLLILSGLDKLLPKLLSNLLSKL